MKIEEMSDSKSHSPPSDESTVNDTTRFHINCSKCGSKFSPRTKERKTAKQHVIYCCSIRPFSCSACQHATFTRTYIKQHINAVCPGSTMIEKDEQEIETAIQKGMETCFPGLLLKEKVEDMKMKASSTTCQKCKAQLRVSNGRTKDLKEHARRCCKIRPFGCSNCDYVGSTKRDVRQHQQAIKSNCLKAQVRLLDEDLLASLTNGSMELCFPKQNAKAVPVNLKESQTKTLFCRRCSLVEQVSPEKFRKHATSHVIRCCEIVRFACSSCLFTNYWRGYMNAHLARNCSGATIKRLERQVYEGALEKGFKDCFPKLNYEFTSISEHNISSTGELQCFKCPWKYNKSTYRTKRATKHALSCCNVGEFTCTGCKAMFHNKWSAGRHTVGCQGELVREEENVMEKRIGAALEECFSDMLDFD